MKFSLVLATINRASELERFLASLNAQTYRDFELIIVDQNSDNRLLSILQNYETLFPIKHLHSEKGLSRARNVGLEHISGDVICFPDDDCWYPAHLFEQLAALFQDNPSYDGVTGICIDELERPSVTNWDSSSGTVTKFNVWRRCTSITIFIKTECLGEASRFDESLGVGAGTPWSAAEDDDFLLSAIEQGLNIYYTPKIQVGHPAVIHQYNADAAKIYSYGGGMGRVLRKHKYPLWFVAYSLLRPFGGMLISILAGNFSKANHHKAALIGRFKGWQARLSEP